MIDAMSELYLIPATLFIGSIRSEVLSLVQDDNAIKMAIIKRSFVFISLKTKLNNLLFFIKLLYKKPKGDKILLNLL